jgi:DNA-binding MarR family transcriptional regulator
MSRPIPFPMGATRLPPGSGVLTFLRLLWAIDHALQSHSKRMARELGITGPQRLVLRVLARYPDLTAGQLASLLHLHPSTLTGVIRRLQGHGLILREVDQGDRRRVRLLLSARGRAMAARHSGSIEAELEKALLRLSPPELAAAEKALTSIGDQLSAIPPGAGPRASPGRRRPRAGR